MKISNKPLLGMLSFSRVLFSVMMALSLSSCSLMEGSPEPPILLNEVNISLDSDANANSATSIDLIIAYDPDLLKVLLGLEAKDYFSIARQIKQDYPELADVIHWELTPGQVVRDYPIELRNDVAYGAVMFADYYVSGPHRVRIGSSEVIHVHFKAGDFCVIEQGCFGAPNPDMSAQAAAFQKNLVFSSIKKVDPKTAIARIESAKTAMTMKDNGKLAELMAAQSSKFVAAPKK